MNLIIGQNKNQDDYFTNTNLSNLIDSFYEMVIKDIYSVQIVEKDTETESIYGSVIKEKLDVGDTRHIAFTSLLLQGVSPIEIAMLGGHTSLDSQDHYQGHSIFYADSEIIDFVTQRNTIHEKMDTTLKDIVFSKSKTPPRMINECIPTEDGVGYCTIDLKAELLDCISDCLRCKYWWCEPTNENFIEIEEYVKNDVIKPLERQIQVEEAYLKNLLEQPRTITVDGLVELEDQYSNDLSKTVKRLNRNITLNKYNIKSLSENKSVIDGLNKIFKEENLWLELKEL